MARDRPRGRRLDAPLQDQLSLPAAPGTRAGQRPRPRSSSRSRTGTTSTCTTRRRAGSSRAPSGPSAPGASASSGPSNSPSASLPPTRRGTRARIEETIAAGSTVNVRLPEPLPVYLLYWTAWVDRDGGLQLREDIYGRDDALLEALARPLTGAPGINRWRKLRPETYLTPMLRRAQTPGGAPPRRPWPPGSRREPSLLPRPCRVGGGGDLSPEYRRALRSRRSAAARRLSFYNLHTDECVETLLLGERELRPDGARADRQRSARPPHRGDPADVPGAHRPGLRADGAAGNAAPRYRSSPATVRLRRTPCCAPAIPGRRRATACTSPARPWISASKAAPCAGSGTPRSP